MSTSKTSNVGRDNYDDVFDLTEGTWDADGESEDCDAATRITLSSDVSVERVESTASDVETGKFALSENRATAVAQALNLLSSVALGELNSGCLIYVNGQAKRDVSLVKLARAFLQTPAPSSARRVSSMGIGMLNDASSGSIYGSIDEQEDWLEEFLRGFETPFRTSEDVANTYTKASNALTMFKVGIGPIASRVVRGEVSSDESIGGRAGGKKYATKGLFIKQIGVGVRNQTIENLYGGSVEAAVSAYVCVVLS